MTSPEDGGPQDRVALRAWLETRELAQAYPVADVVRVLRDELAAPPLLLEVLVLWIFDDEALLTKMWPKLPRSYAEALAAHLRAGAH